MKKIIAIIVLSFMALSLVACGGASSSAAGVAEKAYKALAQSDYAAIVDLTPDYLIADMGADLGLPENCTREDVAKTYQEFFDQMKELAGEDFKIPEIKDFKSEVLKEIKKGDAEFEAKLNDYIESLPSSAVDKFNKDKVEAFAEVKVSGVVDGESGDSTGYCIKYDGKWYIVE
ncbi:MAG: hypothetical protein J6252_01655 [Clostridia bacterium]|nr:hypothetical protein [Clostridia bacterium]